MIISARLPANLSRTRLKSSCGQRNVRLAALRMMALVYQWLENGVSFKINDWQERRKKCYLEFLYCVLTFPVFFILRCLPLTKSNSLPYSSLKYDARQIKISQPTLKPEIFPWLQLLVTFPFKTLHWKLACCWQSFNHLRMPAIWPLRCQSHFLSYRLFTEKGAYYERGIWERASCFICTCPVFLPLEVEWRCERTVVF